jgi:hypothetical protein
VARQKFLGGIHKYEICRLTLKGTRYEFDCSQLARIEFSHRLLGTTIKLQFSQKRSKFIYQLSDCQLYKKDSAS